MPYMTRQDRKDQILRVLRRVHELGAKPSLTMREIANYIGLKPSNHLMKLLLEMTTQGGILKCKTDIHRKAKGNLQRDIYVFRFYIEYMPPIERLLNQPIIRVNGREV